MLQAALRLPKLPRRIDCFDISTIQGSETVASMVVCEEGRMRPSEYRKFKIKQETDRGAPLSPSTPRPAPTLRVSRRFRRHGTSRSAALCEGARERRAVSRSDRDRWRQGPVECCVCSAREDRFVEPGGGWPGEERGARLYARQRSSRSRSTRMALRCACCSAFATRRIASRSRSTASRARIATCSRSSMSSLASGCGDAKCC